MDTGSGFARRVGRPSTVYLALLIGMLACSAPQRPAAAPAPAPAASQPPGAAPAPALSPDLQRLVDGARGEGSLVLSWGPNSIGGDAAVRRWAEGFNKLYGLNLRVDFTPGPAMPQVAARVLQEQQSGRAASTDLYLGVESHVAAMIAADALEPSDWLTWAPNVREPQMVAPGGVAVAINTETIGITYNSARVSGNAIPRSIQDLLKPEYKGRIAGQDNGAQFDRLASEELWGKARTTEYVTRFADQIAGLIRPGELERIASGEFDLFAINTNSSDARLWRAKGAPIEQVIPTDAPMISYKYLGVPRNAPHPNAAKLWINYILSREGQDVLWDTGATDLHYIPGSRTAPELEALRAAGVQLVDLNVDFVLRQGEGEVARTREEFQRILQKRQ
jgi:ABC-type Fe3+ transport system substrate-binding protein